MVWDIFKLLSDDFYLNKEYRTAHNKVFFYNDHLVLTPVVTKRTGRHTILSCNGR